jgi:hypothetical protein
MKAAERPDQQQDRDRDPEKPQQHITSHDVASEKSPSPKRFERAVCSGAPEVDVTWKT